MALRHRLEIVSAERIRDELDKLIQLERPGAGLWFVVDTGLAEEFLPELPAMRLEQDPIHRHKDVLAHTIAVVENVAARRPSRVRLPPHPAGGAVPRRGQAEDPLATARARASPSTTTRWSGARMTRERMQALRYANDDVDAVTRLVELHLRFHTYRMGWTDSAVRRFVRDAGRPARRADRAHPLRLHDPQREEGRWPSPAAWTSSRPASPSWPAEEELRALRPDLDGRQVMEHLGVPPGPVIGEALAFLLELRLEEGPLGRRRGPPPPRRLVGAALSRLRPRACERAAPAPPAPWPPRGPARAARRRRSWIAATP